MTQSTDDSSSWWIMVAICGTDFTAFAMISGPSTLLPLIASEVGFSDSTAAMLTAISTVSMCASKFLGGPMVDKLGGKWALLFLMSGLILAALLLSLAHTVAEIGLWYGFMGFFHGPVYASQAVVVRQYLQPAYFDTAFRYLGITARSSVFALSFIYSLLLRTLTWRNVLRLTVVPGVCATLVLWNSVSNDCPGCVDELKSLIGDESDDDDNNPVSKQKGDSKDSVCKKFGTLFTQKWVYWGLISYIGMQSIGNMQLLMTTYFAGTCEVSETYVPALSAGFPAGVLCSIIGPGYIYKAVKSQKIKSRICQILLFITVMSSIGLLINGITPEGIETTEGYLLGLKVLLTFGLGLGLGTPWYLVFPVTVAHLAPDDMGLVQSSLFGGLGFLASVTMQLATSYLLKSGYNWASVWALVLVCALMAIIAMYQFFKASIPLMEAALAEKKPGLKESLLSPDEQEQELELVPLLQKLDAFVDRVFFRCNRAQIITHHKNEKKNLKNKSTHSDRVLSLP